jgi:hypothetical protein
MSFWGSTSLFSVILSVAKNLIPHSEIATSLALLAMTVNKSLLLRNGYNPDANDYKQNS